MGYSFVVHFQHVGCCLVLVVEMMQTQDTLPCLWCRPYQVDVGHCALDLGLVVDALGHLFTFLDDAH